MRLLLLLLFLFEAYHIVSGFGAKNKKKGIITVYWVIFPPAPVTFPAVMFPAPVVILSPIVMFWVMFPAPVVILSPIVMFWANAGGVAKVMGPTIAAIPNAATIATTANTSFAFIDFV